MPTKTTTLPAARKPFKERPAWFKTLCGLGLFTAISCLVFLFSPYTKVQALICSGNYYYTPQQIYQIAGVSINNRTYTHPAGALEKKLEENPLISSAQVYREGQNLNISIQEKTIIGYYEKDGANYLVTSDNERIPIENQTELRTLIHFPLLADLPDEDIKAIAREVRTHPDLLTRPVLEKIAEILPWQESYDKHMLKLVLQDGNTVFTSINSLFMMSTYQQVLSNLQGENVCLLLDGDNGVVNKVACSYMYLSPEERAENREIPKSVLNSRLYPQDDSSQSSSQTSSSEHSLQAQENPDSSETQVSQPQDAAQPNAAPAGNGGQAGQEQAAQAPAAPPASEPSIPADLSTISDWEPSAVENIQYSPSSGLFYSHDTGSYYTYDAATDSFILY